MAEGTVNPEGQTPVKPSFKIPTETLMNSEPSEVKEAIRPDQDLSPFEHLMSGSTTQIEEGGRKINVTQENLRWLMRDPNIRHILLSPTNLTNGKRTLEEVINARKEIITSGKFSIFVRNRSIKEYSERGVDPAFRPGKLDEKGELTSFGVYFRNNNTGKYPQFRKDPFANLIIADNFKDFVECRGKENNVMSFRVKSLEETLK